MLFERMTHPPHLNLEKEEPALPWVGSGTGCNSSFFPERYSERKNFEMSTLQNGALRADARKRVAAPDFCTAEELVGKWRRFNDLRGIRIQRYIYSWNIRRLHLWREQS